MEYKHELQIHNFVKLLNCTSPFKIPDETRRIGIQEKKKKKQYLFSTKLFDLDFREIEESRDFQ